MISCKRITAATQPASQHLADNNRARFGLLQFHENEPRPGKTTFLDRQWCVTQGLTRVVEHLARGTEDLPVSHINDAFQDRQNVPADRAILCPFLRERAEKRPMM
jgi:hypothetical protein